MPVIIVRRYQPLLLNVEFSSRNWFIAVYMRYISKPNLPYNVEIRTKCTFHKLGQPYVCIR